MDAKIKQQLQGCSTLNEMLDVLNEYYDMDKPLLPIAKGLIINKLPSIIVTTGTPKR
jgi:hypothetical protein